MTLLSSCFSPELVPSQFCHFSPFLYSINRGSHEMSLFREQLVMSVCKIETAKIHLRLGSLVNAHIGAAGPPLLSAVSPVSITSREKKHLVIRFSVQFHRRYLRSLLGPFTPNLTDKSCRFCVGLCVGVCVCHCEGAQLVAQ